MKINKITIIHRGLYAHICPLCGAILASSSDPDFMPEFSICSCDRKTGAPPAFELFKDQGYVMISRNKFPRFTGIVIMGESPSIEKINWLDECTEKDSEKALKKAEIFLKRSKYRNE